MERETRIGLQILRDTKTTMKRFLVILPMLQTEDIDLNKLFQQAKWKEVEEVTTEAYEVEKVTATAGVRGNEAEHEILNYLYYIVDTKTRENSLKLDKP